MRISVSWAGANGAWRPPCTTTALPWLCPIRCRPGAAAPTGAASASCSDVADSRRPLIWRGLEREVRGEDVTLRRRGRVRPRVPEHRVVTPRPARSSSRAAKYETRLRPSPSTSRGSHDGTNPAACEAASSRSVVTSPGCRPCTTTCTTRSTTLPGPTRRERRPVVPARRASSGGPSMGTASSRTTRLSCRHARSQLSDVLAEEVPPGGRGTHERVGERPQDAARDLVPHDGRPEQVRPGVLVVGRQRLPPVARAPVTASRMFETITSSTAPPTAPSGASVQTPSRNASADTNSSVTREVRHARARAAPATSPVPKLVAERRARGPPAVEQPADEVAPRPAAAPARTRERPERDEQLLPQQPARAAPARPAGSAGSTSSPRSATVSPANSANTTTSRNPVAANSVKR